LHDSLILRFLLLSIALATALFATTLFPPLKPIDHVLDDWRMHAVLSTQEEERIVVVDIDEQSVAQLGVWPWPRTTVAKLLKTLIDDYGVSSIAVDMFIPEPGAGDDELATQFSRPQVTGAVVYDLEHRNLRSLSLRLPAPPPLTVIDGAPLQNGILVVANHAGLIPGQVGHITPYFDDDGALRRVPPLVCTDKLNCRPILTLSAYASLIDRPRMVLEKGQGLLASPWSLAISGAVGAPIVNIPLDSNGALIVPYRHTNATWVRASAADVLTGKVNPAVMKNVMVLLGGTALGMGDVIATPASPVAAGLEPHVEILAALLDNDFLTAPRGGLLFDTLLMLPFIAVMALGRFRKPAQRAAIFPIWLLAAWGFGAAMAMLAFTRMSLLLPLTPLLLFPPLALLLVGLLELYRSGSEHDGVLALLAAYLPRPVAIRLAGLTHQGHARGKEVGVDATRREITVLFADIHGFAGITEGRPPELIARLMQRVFSEMAESVAQHHGTIDKFIGDAIMAFWNAPEDDPNHASHAMAAAQDIQRRIAALGPYCAELGIDALRIGVGVESGQALVGNFGSAHRRTFTALGEPVVLASRLEGLTNVYNEPLLIGPGCARALGIHTLRELCTVQIRGRVQALTLYVPK
jgi:adenylate cyclase